MTSSFPATLPSEGLVVTHLTKRYGSRRVLEDVSFTCGPGSLAVVMGDNGTGKSTLLKIVAGLVAANAGEVALLGQRIRPGEVAGRSALGLVTDHADLLPDLAVGELIELAVALKRCPPPSDALIETFSLRALLGQRLRTLSFGQRKRALFVTALVGDPWLLILDEPSNGLDPTSVATVGALLRERQAAGKAALVATNDGAFAASLGGPHFHLDAGALKTLAPTT
jgi:ABC-type multidrug transport system ATPase subunit